MRISRIIKMLPSWGVLSFLLLNTCTLWAQAEPDTIWTKTLGGSGNEPLGFGVGFSGAPAMSGAVLPNGDIYVAATTVSTDGDLNNNYGSEDVWLIKLNSQGDTLWTKVIGGTAADRVYEMKATADGGCVLAGRSNSNDNDFQGSNGSSDGFLTKVDSSGNILFSNLYGGSQVDEFLNVLILDDGGYLVLGTTGSIDGDVPAGNAGSVEAWVMRLNADATVRWSRKTSGLTVNLDYNELFYDAVVHTNGYILGGISGDFANFNTDDFLIVKYDSLGNQLWMREMGTAVGDALAAMLIENDTSIFVMGRVSQASGDVSTYNGGNGDTWLVNLDSTGAIRWEQTYGGSDFEYSYGLNFDPGGDLLISGLSRSTDGNLPDTSYGNFDFWLMEVSPIGDSLNSWRWGGSSSDYLHEVAFNGNDSSELILIGRSQSSDFWVPSNQGGNDLYIAKMEYAPVSIPSFVSIPKLPALKLYPNPSSGSFQIEIPEGQYQHLEIYNALGQQVFRQVSPQAGAYQLHLNLPAGSYFVQLLDEQGQKQQARLILH